MKSDKEKNSVASIQQSADIPAAVSIRDDGHAMRATTAHEPPQDNRNKIEHSLPWVPWVAEQGMRLNAAHQGRPRRSSLYAGSARRGVGVTPPTHMRRLSAQDDQLTAEAAETWQHTTPRPSSQLLITSAAQEPDLIDAGARSGISVEHKAADGDAVAQDLGLVAPVMTKEASTTSSVSSPRTFEAASGGLSAAGDSHRTFVQSLVGKTVGINVYASAKERLIGKVLSADSEADVLTVRHIRNNGSAWEELYHYDRVTGKLDSHLTFTVLDSEAGILEKMERQASKMSKVEQTNLGKYVLSVDSPRQFQPIVKSASQRAVVAMAEAAPSPSKHVPKERSGLGAEHTSAVLGTSGAQFTSAQLAKMNTARRRARRAQKASRRRASAKARAKTMAQAEGHVFAKQLLRLDSLSSASSQSSASDSESDAGSGSGSLGTDTGSESEVELDSWVGRTIEIVEGDGQGVQGLVLSVDGNELTVMHGTAGADDEKYEENYMYDRHTGMLDGWLSFKLLGDIDRTRDSDRGSGRSFTRRPSMRESIKAAEFIVKEVVLQRDDMGLGMALQYDGTPPEHRIWVDALLPGRPAALSGELQPGDQVIAINGQRVPFIKIHTVGKLLSQPTIHLTTKRKVPMLAVTLTRGETGLGMVLSFERGTSVQPSVWVDALLPNMPAANSGQVQAGDQIVSINGDKIEQLTVHQVNARLKAESVTLQLKRNMPAMPTIAIAQQASNAINNTDSGIMSTGSGNNGGTYASAAIGAVVSDDRQGGIRGVADGRHLSRRPSVQEGITEAKYIDLSVTLSRDSRGLGMSLEYDGMPPEHRVWIDALIPGRPAASCEQLEHGDRLMAVNEQQISLMTVPQMSKLLQSPTVRLRVRRKVLLKTVVLKRDKQGLGMVLEYIGQAPNLIVRVDEIFPMRPAALTQKLQVGDNITEVDGVRVKALMVGQVNAMLGARETVQLTVQRASVEESQNAKRRRQRALRQGKLNTNKPRQRAQAIKRAWNKVSKQFARWAGSARQSIDQEQTSRTYAAGSAPGTGSNVAVMQLAQQLDELQINIAPDATAPACTGKQAFAEALDPIENNVACQVSTATPDMKVVQDVTNPIPVLQAVQCETKQSQSQSSIEVDATRTASDVDSTVQQGQQQEPEHEQREAHKKDRNQGHGQGPHSEQISKAGTDYAEAKCIAGDEVEIVPSSARNERKLSERLPHARPSNTFSEAGASASLRKQHPHALKFRQQRARSEAVLMDAAVGKIANGSKGWATDATACKAQGNAVLGLRLFLGRIGDDAVDGDLLSITTGEAADLFGTV